MFALTGYIRFTCLRERKLLHLCRQLTCKKNFCSHSSVTNLTICSRLSNTAPNSFQINKAVTILMNQQRWKSKRKMKDTDESSDEDEEEYDQEFEDDDDDLVKDHKEVTIHVNSTRVDAVITAALNMSRTKAERAVYENKVRINGEKVLKKGVKVESGDEVDFIKSVNAKNENLLDISRLVIKNVNVKTGGGKSVIILDRYKTLTIENYPDMWKPIEEL